jgi:predicted secreted hydrolase
MSPDIEEPMMTSFTTDQYAPAEQVSVDGVTYEVAESRSVVDIDGDLPWHSGRWPMESWFVVSNLDCDRQRIGLQVQFMIQHLPAGTDVVALNVAVVNETSGTPRTFEYIYSLDQVEVSADRLHISTPELTLSGDRHGCTVSFRGEHAQIDISTTAAAPPLLFNGEGQIVFLGVNEQYDYAFPAMPTTGTVVLDTVTYEVTGASWLDRQWGGLPSFFSDPSADSVQAANSMNWI